MKDLKLSLREKNIKHTTQPEFVGLCNMLKAEIQMYIFPLILKKQLVVITLRQTKTFKCLT